MTNFIKYGGEKKEKAKIELNYFDISIDEVGFVVDCNIKMFP